MSQQELGTACIPILLRRGSRFGDGIGGVAPTEAGQGSNATAEKPPGSLARVRPGEGELGSGCDGLEGQGEEGSRDAGVVGFVPESVMAKVSFFVPHPVLFLLGCLHRYVSVEFSRYSCSKERGVLICLLAFCFDALFSIMGGVLDTKRQNRNTKFVLNHWRE